nr:DUF1016 N-terminal domain-containing protein [Pseudanabaena sp. 'Roaring Creek']
MTPIVGYSDLLERISQTYTEGRIQAVQAVNIHLVETCWQVGRHIVEFEQNGKIRADYGRGLISSLSKDLTFRHGKGFSRSNLIRCRQFYLTYPKSATLSQQLSWAHVAELLKMEDPLERNFYELPTLLERWSVRELIRQKESALFLRLAASKDREGILMRYNITILDR